MAIERIIKERGNELHYDPNDQPSWLVHACNFIMYGHLVYKEII